MSGVYKIRYTKQASTPTGGGTQLANQTLKSQLFFPIKLKVLFIGHTTATILGFMTGKDTLNGEELEIG